MKQLRRLTFSDMRDLSEGIRKKGEGRMHITPDFGVGIDIRGMFPQLMKTDEPLLMEDSRIGIFLKGEAEITVNLIDYDIKPGTAVYVSKGSVVQVNSASSETMFSGMVFDDDWLAAALHGHMPKAFNGEQMHFYKQVTDEQVAVIDNLFRTVWTITHQQGYNRETIEGLTYTLFYYYDSISKTGEECVRSSHSRDRELFERFLNLVNKHGAKERSLAFYADHMCLTERYLGTAVRNASGQTAKTWIDRAAITAAKVMLRHSNKPVSQIADEMMFANASFFSKYFRRLEGMTPGCYRTGR